jgi:L-2-hydroxyglutarate oxidase LhgO
MFKSEAVVVGAGVIGLSVARALAARGLEVLVLESEPGIGQGVSSRNSEVIHAGLYYLPGSLKARLCVEGRRALYQYCADRGVPHRRCGKLVVATALDEDAAVQALYQRAQANGVEDIELIGQTRLKRLEPEVQGTSALVSGSTGIVDGHTLMLAYQGDAEAAGVTVQLRAPLAEAHGTGASIVLRTGGPEPAEIETGLLVNAAGLQAWGVSSRLQGLDPATIPPRHLTKGSYFSMGGRAPFSHLIYPVPVAAGLGIHLTFDLGGAARFGPDAEWVEAIDYAVDPRRAENFYAAIRRYWPHLPDDVLVPDYAGIRPRVAGPGEPAGDFVIQGPEATGHQAYVALYGIDSPGLTASLAVGEYVADLVLGSGSNRYG